MTDVAIIGAAAPVAPGTALPCQLLAARS